ncbi:MAG: endolytic transglycosylase MltG [Lachnospiraceae bacterium]|nr:endolytic transglycosylase MltG [Lachnospiraceae bacterium]
MKFKYFLRGLGFGIVFSAIICLTAYQGNSNQHMTDEEVIRRAEELGMVQPEDKVGELLEIDKQNKDSKKDKTSPNNTETVKQEENSEEESIETKENKDTASEKISATEENAKTENHSSEQEEKKSEASTEKKEDTTEKQSDKKEKTVKLTIERGSSSFPVCQKLQELGLIENASDFDTYLVENGYASRIRVGEHTLKKGMSYQDIAEAISDPL